MKLSEAIRQYLEWKAGNTSRAYQVYEIHLRRFLTMYPDREVEDITILDVSRFQASMNFKYKEGTIAQNIIVLKNFFDFHKRQGRGVIDPYFVRIPRFGVTPHEAVTAEEFLAMDSVLREDDFHQLQKKLVIHLLYYTGVRVSELCALTMAQVAREPRMMIQNKKNKKYRWIFWPEGETHRLFLKYLEMRQELPWGSALITTRHAVNQGNNGHMTTRSVQRWVKDIARLAGIRRQITCHCFRSSRLQRASKKNLIAAKEIAGHTTVASTQVYVNYNPAYIEELARETFY